MENCHCNRRFRGSLWEALELGWPCRVILNCGKQTDPWIPHWPAIWCGLPVLSGHSFGQDSALKWWAEPREDVCSVLSGATTDTGKKPWCAIQRILKRHAGRSSWGRSRRRRRKEREWEGEESGRLLSFFFVFWLCWVFTEVHWLLLLKHTDSAIPASGLSYPLACGISAPPSGTELEFPALEGGLLTTTPPRKSHSCLSFLCFSFLSLSYSSLPSFLSPAPFLPSSFIYSWEISWYYL